MSDVLANGPGGSRRGLGPKRKYEGYDTAKPPTDEELAAQESPDDRAGERVDRYSLFTPEQVEDETRNVRLDFSFGDVAKIRDQAEMIARCMEEIIKKTREHKIGSIRQRIDARAEADSLRRVMARFNGKCPHGDRYVPKSRR